jgi:superfamily II DNA or RNA helicase
MSIDSSSSSSPTLSTTLFEPQIFAKNQLLTLYNNRHENNGAGAILSLAYGGGKSLTFLSFCSDILGSWQNNPILIVSPFSVIYDWTREGKVHFSPKLKTIFLESKNAKIKSWEKLSGKHIVFINYEMLVQAYELALETRDKIYLKKIHKLRDKYVTNPSFVPAQLNQVEQLYLHEKIGKINYLETLRNIHVANPDLTKPIPVSKLAKKEKNKVYTTSLLSLYYHHWAVIGYDEVHVARTDTTKKHQACLQLRAHFKVSITATPFNNGFPDFISAFKLANITPEMPNVTWSDVENDDNLCAAVISKLRHKYVIHNFNELTVSQDAYNAQDIIVYQPFIHEEERLLYKMIKENKSFEGDEEKCALEIICPLRRACAGIYEKSLIPKSIANKFTPIQDQNGEFSNVAFRMPTKIIMLLYMLAQVIEGWNNIVIFTEFKDTAKCIVQHIQQAFPEVIVLMATGDTSSKERERLRAIFEDKYVTTTTEVVSSATRGQRPPQKKLRNVTNGAPKTKILVCTNILSDGVNLPEANVTFHVDTWWNPARDEQAKKRVARPGQTHNIVHITLMIADDTIEKDIWMVKEGKRDINRIIMSGGTIDAGLVSKVTTSSALSTLKKLEKPSSSSSSISHQEDEVIAKMKMLGAILPDSVVEKLKTVTDSSFLELMRSRCDLLITDCRDTSSYKIPDFVPLQNCIKLKGKLLEDVPLIEKMTALEQAKILEKRYTFKTKQRTEKRTRAEISNEKKKRTIIRIPDSENF